MSKVQAQYLAQARSSTETEERHLLAPSIAASETASTIDGDRTPRAQSPSRASRTSDSYERRGTVAESAPTSRPYKGFQSEEAYLQALREWAEEKKYIHHDRTLVGFYGNTTMAELASRPSPQVEMGLKRKWRERKARKEQQKEGRRNTVA